MTGHLVVGDLIQQAEDVSGFMELFAKHAVRTTAHGKRIARRDPRVDGTV